MVPLLAVAVSLIILVFLVFPAPGLAQTGPMRQQTIESLRDKPLGPDGESLRVPATSEDVDPTANWLDMTGIGTAGGAVAGTLIGAAIPRWTRRYP